MKEDTNISLLREIRDLLKNKTVPVSATPENTNGTWTITVPEGMTIEKALAECKALFSVQRWTDKNMDEIVTSDRDTKKAYTIKFKSNVEADEELKNLSANDLRGRKTITLLERILLELDYFKRTGEHLDVENITLCAGSRDTVGFVPRCHWLDGKFYVYWLCLGYSGSSLRARVAVL